MLGLAFFISMWRECMKNFHSRLSNQNETARAFIFKNILCSKQQNFQIPKFEANSIDCTPVVTFSYNNVLKTFANVKQFDEVLKAKI